MRRYAQEHSSPRVNTVFVGGGTPTALRRQLLLDVILSSHEAFDIASDAEITVEANPGTVDLGLLSMLLQAGVSRVSFGVQSFLNHELQLLGRSHGTVEALAAVDLARQAGFGNINIDLIYGLPHQDTHHWMSTMRKAVALAPQHLSIYSLSVEPGTMLAEHISAGELTPPDDDAAAEMYTAAEMVLRQAGYQHYELSNWAAAALDHDRKPRSAVCRHNLRYWLREPYLGFGAGAHSFCEGRRWSNLADPEAYCCSIERGISPVDQCRRIGPAESMDETMVLGLRLVRGVRYSDFRNEHGSDLRQVYAQEVQDLREAGLIAERDDGIALTARGRLLGNQVFARFWRGEADN